MCCSAAAKTFRELDQNAIPHTKGDWQNGAPKNATSVWNKLVKKMMGGTRAHKPDLAQRAYLHREGRALWNVHCAVCHGTNGNANPQNFNPAPRKLGGMGLKMGFFFGGDKMRAGIFIKSKPELTQTQTSTATKCHHFVICFTTNRSGRLFFT